MPRAETDPGFYETLHRHGAARAAAFDPSRERAAWAALLERACRNADARHRRGIDAPAIVPALLAS